MSDPSHDEEILILHNTCVKYKVSPSEYLFDYELSGRDRFDIDMTVNFIASELENELNEEAKEKAEAANGSN